MYRLVSRYKSVHGRNYLLASPSIQGSVWWEVDSTTHGSCIDKSVFKIGVAGQELIPEKRSILHVLE